MLNIKKSFKIIGCAFIILVAVMGSSIISNGEQSLNITNWIIESNISENGDLGIIEDITFNFKGKYNGVFREIVSEGTSGIEGIKVIENDKNTTPEYNKVKDAKNGDSNVFLVNEKDNSVTLLVLILSIISLINKNILGLPLIFTSNLMLF